MDFIFNIAIVLFSVNIVIISTLWYLRAVVKPNFPSIWKNNFVDEDPFYTRRKL